MAGDTSSQALGLIGPLVGLVGNLIFPKIEFLLGPAVAPMSLVAGSSTTALPCDCCCCCCAAIPLTSCLAASLPGPELREVDSLRASWWAFVDILSSSPVCAREYGRRYACERGKGGKEGGENGQFSGGMMPADQQVHDRSCVSQRVEWSIGRPGESEAHLTIPPLPEPYHLFDFRLSGF